VADEVCEKDKDINLKINYIVKVCGRIGKRQYRSESLKIRDGKCASIDETVNIKLKTILSAD